MYRVRAKPNGAVVIGGGRVHLSDLAEVNALVVILSDHLAREDPENKRRWERAR